MDIDKISSKIELSVTKNTIGLISTVQYVSQLPLIQKKLNDISSRKFIISNGDKRTIYKGQILGCNFSSANNCIIKYKCEEFIYIGDGNFHPIGISISTKKNVICIDPNTFETKVINTKSYYMKRNAILSNLINLNPKKYGIIISTKNGQKRIDLAMSIYNKIINLKLEGYLIVLDEITPYKLRSFNVDVFINTACPRLSVDDSSLYHVPLITYPEFKILIGEEKWENIKIDEILEP